MSVMVSVEIPVQPAKFDEAIAMFKDILPDTRAFDGCESCDTYLDRENSKILLVEMWAEAANQEAYMAWRAEMGFMDQLGGFLGGAPSIGTWEPATDV